MGGLSRVIKDVKNIGFDLGLDPRGDLISILIMWLGGVRYRVGYGITGGGFLLNKECRYDKNMHVIDRNLKLLKAIGVPVTDRSARIYFNEKDIAVVEGLLRPLGTRNDGKAVVLHPFAGAFTREWSRDKVQKLIDSMDRDGIKVYLIGTNKDAGLYDRVTDMRGKFSLPQLAYFIKKIGYFAGLNSGPANMAAALGVPSVIISSGSNIIEHWIPESAKTKFIYKGISCRPCEMKVCPKERYECMDGISVEDVMKEIASALRASQ
jgi:heptosyltransferase-2